jgi:hypothetical protein
MEDGCLKMEDGKRMMEIENYGYHIIRLTSSILHKKGELSIKTIPLYQLAVVVSKFVSF